MMPQQKRATSPPISTGRMSGIGSSPTTSWLRLRSTAAARRSAKGGLAAAIGGEPSPPKRRGGGRGGGAAARGGNPPPWKGGGPRRRAPRPLVVPGAGSAFEGCLELASG